MSSHRRCPPSPHLTIPVSLTRCLPTRSAAAVLNAMNRVAAGVLFGQGVTVLALVLKPPVGTFVVVVARTQRLKVCGIDARWNLTGVVNLKLRRDGPNEPRVRHAVSAERRERRVALAVSGASPEPTAGRIDHDLCEEAPEGLSGKARRRFHAAAPCASRRYRLTGWPRAMANFLAVRGERWTPPKNRVTVVTLTPASPAKSL